MSGTVSLARYQGLEPDGTHYFEDDLQDPDKVKELFDYCQILLANITKEGWRFLIKNYGFPGLLAINNKSGWFDETDDREAMGEIREHCLISGYESDRDKFGEYDPETGVFSPLMEGR
ncbi:MAG: hypothetical protein O2909_08235 [Chloroflexi bacterium]|nr:hypothetical protein [Chloroflexota bacterium]MDA1219416.1 hypothetical protein [Chloroflexota bacterium]